uniref:Pentatricopeptide repeat-containing protein At4g01400, mitochondrial n=1 Tax=Anthurium amnicola TaxID=1678845 RepID=A0A1D1YT00_9ARAE
MLSPLVKRAHLRLFPHLRLLPFSSSSSDEPPLPLLPADCSPARLRKLIAAQRDPFLAKDIFDLAASLRPDVFSPSSPRSYPSLHVLVLKLARARRFSLADSILRRLPSPSPGLFSSLIQIYADAGLPDRALSTFHSMLLLPRPACRPRPRHLNRLLTALAARSDYLPAALRILRSADSLGIPPGVRSYNTLIKAFCRNGRLSVAYHLFNTMIEKGLAPDVESYRTLMQGLCRKSQVNTAVDLLEDMLNKGYVPDSLSYTTLLNSLCRKKKLREAYKLLCRMKVKGCNPDIVHYNTVILGFCREGRPRDACKVLEDMPDNGCLPNLVTYATLVNGLCSRSLLDEGNRYLMEMMSKGLVPHFSVFHTLVKGFCNVGKFEEACGVLGEMLSRGVAPHVETWVMVLPGVCDDAGEKSMQGVKKVVMEDEWRRSTRIVRAGCELEEYMVRKLRGKGSWRC